MTNVNKPDVSKTIKWMYWGIVVFLAAMSTSFAFAGFLTPMGTAGIAASLLMVAIESVMVLLLRSLYRTRYILTDEEPVIKTSKLIGGNKTIPLKTIDSVEATPIPLGFRMFGASFHGGYYHVPSVGRTFEAITNFHDGLLIKSRTGNYVITPKDHMHFKEAIETRRKI
ncbi:PH domain-containing protein [Candidatus Bathyarchaeota archaeon]|nr:PH domain-containing protein [Candidatus Bathyarchaeota archaeon]